jgi:mono/diheme cytochrome c family protein
MAQSLQRSDKPAFDRQAPWHRKLRGAGVVVATLLLVGCAVEIENTRASQEVARLAEPAGSTYLGWRVFQNKCAACHGPAALGTGNGPDLLPRVRDMGARQFVSIVLRRYDWSQAATQARGDDAALNAMVEKIIQRQDFPLNMPAWEGEPSVTAHLTDLYAYLSARAAGTQGTGRPVQ